MEWLIDSTMYGQLVSYLSRRSSFYLQKTSSRLKRTLRLLRCINRWRKLQEECYPALAHYGDYGVTSDGIKESNTTSFCSTTTKQEAKIKYKFEEPAGDLSHTQIE